jgi:hypothetical protein
MGLTPPQGKGDWSLRASSGRDSITYTLSNEKMKELRSAYAAAVKKMKTLRAGTAENASSAGRIEFRVFNNKAGGYSMSIFFPPVVRVTVDFGDKPNNQQFEAVLNGSKP